VFWILGAVLAWFVLALLVGLVIGRAIHMADQRAPGVDTALSRAGAAGARAGRALAPRTRRRVPLPPIAIALAAVAVGLEGVGYGIRLSGATGQAARLLSMDAPFSVPRLFVAALFAAAAIAAFVGAGSIPGRQGWWTAVAVVAGGIAVVKAGSTLHVDVFQALSSFVSTAGAIIVSAVFAAAVIGWLWSMSGGDQRDRRRVLTSLACYAGASVGLSAVSTLVADGVGRASRWAAMATFIEESGEALTAVTFLTAVLVGVAPRLVLPADWALRRTVDAHTLDLPDAVSRPVDRPSPG
jgi:hypothetical protein